jgi:hypothetical protein
LKRRNRKKVKGAKNICGKKSLRFLQTFEKYITPGGGIFGFELNDLR